VHRETQWQLWCSC